MGTGDVVIWILLGVMLVAMLVLPTISQKKRIKEFNDMVDGLHVGEEVRTVGGIIGKITKINNKDEGKTVLIETGDKSNKCVMEFDVAAIGIVIKQSGKKAEQKETAIVEEKQEEKTVEEKAEGSVSEDIVKAGAKKKTNKKR